MLTGMTNITRGTASVLGLNLHTHMADARRIYGVCPQHDILFPTLTVRDHLVLFASLKGVPNEEIGPMVDLAIEEVQLVAEAGLEQEAVTMSGGQKRRLCLAIALIAESKVVFLDEPTCVTASIIRSLPTSHFPLSLSCALLLILNLLFCFPSFHFLLFSVLRSSGVDPFSRRAIWDLLVQKKRDRIIILTTHFMVRFFLFIVFSRD